MFELLKRMNRQEVILLLLCAGMVVCQVGFTLQMPVYMEIITELVQSGNTDPTIVTQNGIYMVLCAFAAAASAIAAHYFSVQMASRFSRDLRRDIFYQIESYSLAEIDDFSTASLITRSTNDVTQVQNCLARGLRHTLMAPIYAIWALSRITGHYAIWTQLTFIGILVMCCMIVFLVRYAHPRLRRRQEYTDNLSRVLRENLTGIYVIRANNAEKLQEEKFEKENTVLTVNERKAHHGMGLMRPTIQLTSNLLAAGIYVSGAYLIQQAGAAEQLTIFSEMIAFTSYTANLIQSFMNMNIALNMYPRAAVSSERILEVLSRQSTIKDPAQPVSPEPLGTLAFQHVSFTYPGTHQEVLKDVSFAVEKGKTLGIIGSTGSGKTTLMNLIPRLYDVSSGTVLVDGVDVRAMSQQDLRSRIGYASQQAVLLSGTVDYNVQYGPSKQPLSTKEALDIAQASEFVDSMPGGQQAEVARGGANLSGGQKQRLSIARAVRRHPEFYLFDDTFSALDYKTDRALRTALRKQTAGVTTILVSQRIETIRDADEILVLDQGQIAGRGSHAELLRSCPVYREIARTQLPEEEVSGDGEGSL